MDDLVKPHLKEQWSKEISPYWFADDTPEKQKTPGFIKKEFETTNGSLVCLSAKCYIINEGAKLKRSSKGTPRSVDLSVADFEAALFQGQIPNAEFSQILFNKKIGSSVTKKTSKRSINPIYYKLRVAENSVDVHPLIYKGKYVY